MTNQLSESECSSNRQVKHQDGYTVHIVLTGLFVQNAYNPSITGISGFGQK